MGAAVKFDHLDDILDLVLWDKEPREGHAREAVYAEMKRAYQRAHGAHSKAETRAFGGLMEKIEAEWEAIIARTMRPVITYPKGFVARLASWHAA